MLADIACCTLASIHFVLEVVYDIQPYQAANARISRLNDRAKRIPFIFTELLRIIFLDYAGCSGDSDSRVINKNGLSVPGKMRELQKQKIYRLPKVYG